ncbi:MAG: hypothetical protein PWQ29_434 [Verrucomicrobiota bacterium]|jgi:predicted dehydrogenase|nr:hypothetical protein [Verrucomicrobiota bacterium]
MNKHKDVVNWGVLSTANIGLTKVLPAMMKGSHVKLAAIASRNPERAKVAAKDLNIPKTYGSYEELLEDPGIQAVYIPLPNHMHVEWIRKSLLAGKHVLCEKPLVMQAREIQELEELANTSNLLVGEAFMVLHHPRWIRVKDLISSGSIGRLISGNSVFSYYNTDKDNIRNNPAYGGGAIYDIGCYPIVVSRFVFGEEPVRVISTVEQDPEFKTDRLASAILEFPSGTMTFTVSTQMVPYQVVQFFGTEKMVEVRAPFNTPYDRPTSIHIHSGDILQDLQVAETFDECDQYTIQGDNFSRAILYGESFAGSLKNALGNAKVIDSLFKSADSGTWELV